MKLHDVIIDVAGRILKRFSADTSIKIMKSLSVAPYYSTEIDQNVIKREDLVDAILYMDFQFIIWGATNIDEIFNFNSDNGYDVDTSEQLNEATNGFTYDQHTRLFRVLKFYVDNKITSDITLTT